MVADHRDMRGGVIGPVMRVTTRRGVRPRAAPPSGSAYVSALKTAGPTSLVHEPFVIVLALLSCSSRPPTRRRTGSRTWPTRSRARLDEPTGCCAGTERIEYRNNSPDTLATFALHLHLNAFRPGSRWADADSAEGLRRFNDLRDPGLRVQSRARRPDHGRGRSSRSIPSRRTAPSCASRCPRPSARRRR